jgi:hypothetical protein
MALIAAFEPMLRFGLESAGGVTAKVDETGTGLALMEAFTAPATRSQQRQASGMLVQRRQRQPPGGVATDGGARVPLSSGVPGPGWGAKHISVDTSSKLQGRHSSTALLQSERNDPANLLQALVTKCATAA